MLLVYKRDMGNDKNGCDRKCVRSITPRMYIQDVLAGSVAT